jgi:hypothetical protein
MAGRLAASCRSFAWICQRDIAPPVIHEMTACSESSVEPGLKPLFSFSCALEGVEIQPRRAEVLRRLRIVGLLQRAVWIVGQIVVNELAE